MAREHTILKTESYLLEKEYILYLIHVNVNVLLSSCRYSCIANCLLCIEVGLHTRRCMYMHVVAIHRFCKLVLSLLSDHLQLLPSLSIFI